MEIGEELNQIILAAYNEAKARRHEYFTPEHLLYASLFFDKGMDILYHCGGDIEDLKVEIEDYFNKYYERTPVNKDPVESTGLQNVLTRALFSVSDSEKKEIGYW